MLRQIFMETFVHGPRRRAGSNFGTTGSVPAIPPLEKRIRDHRNRTPWRRLKVLDEARATVPDDTSPVSAYIVVGGTAGAFVAGLFAFCVAVPDVAHDIFIQQPKDGIIRRLPTGLVGEEAQHDALDRMRTRAHKISAHIKPDGL